MEAPEGAVGRVHDTAAAVAAEGHRVGHHGVNAGGAVRQLKGLVVHSAVRAHVLIDVAVEDLADGVLEMEACEGQDKIKRIVKVVEVTWGKKTSEIRCTSALLVR